MQRLEHWGMPERNCGSLGAWRLEHINICNINPPHGKKQKHKILNKIKTTVHFANAKNSRRRACITFWCMQVLHLLFESLDVCVELLVTLLRFLQLTIRPQRTNHTLLTLITDPCITLSICFQMSEEQFSNQHEMVLSNDFTDVILNQTEGVSYHSVVMRDAFTLFSSSWMVCLALISASSADWSSRRADMSSLARRLIFHGIS